MIFFHPMVQSTQKIITFSLGLKKSEILLKQSGFFVLFH